MKLETFAVEAWMTDHENCCAYNMADSCCAALSLRELLAYASAQERKVLEDIVLDYGPIIGSLTLRRHIASLYAYDDPDSVTLAHGCINANELVLMTLLEPGDHVVTLLPTYQQLYAFPESLGCAVTKIALKEKMGWQADLQAICAAVTPQTRLICLNFPTIRPALVRIVRSWNSCVRFARRAASGSSVMKYIRDWIRNMSAACLICMRAGSVHLLCRRRWRWPDCASAGSIVRTLICLPASMRGAIIM